MSKSVLILKVDLQNLGSNMSVQNIANPPPKIVLRNLTLFVHPLHQALLKNEF